MIKIENSWYRVWTFLIRIDGFNVMRGREHLVHNLCRSGDRIVQWRAALCHVYTEIIARVIMCSLVVAYTNRSSVKGGMRVGIERLAKYVSELPTTAERVFDGVFNDNN